MCVLDRPQPASALPFNRLWYLLRVIRACRRRRIITRLIYHVPHILHATPDTIHDRSEVDTPTESDSVWRKHLIARGIPVFVGNLAPLWHMEIVGNARDLSLPCAFFGRTGKLLPHGRRGQTSDHPGCEPAHFSHCSSSSTFP